VFGRDPSGFAHFHASWRVSQAAPAGTGHRNGRGLAEQSQCAGVRESGDHWAILKSLIIESGTAANLTSERSWSAFTQEERRRKYAASPKSKVLTSSNNSHPGMGNVQAGSPKSRP
jgi:hypothetical protein